MINRNIGFFGDIGAFLLKLLAGFISFVVITNLFLNKIDQIFEIKDIELAFNLFSCIYFILPVAILLIWIGFGKGNIFLSRLIPDD